jgi:hypothetical protein
VLAVFNTFKILIVDLDSWESRAEDVIFRERSIEVYKNKGLYELADTLETEIDAWRYRPEEVADSCSADLIPVVYRDALQHADDAMGELRTYYQRRGISL